MQWAETLNKSWLMFCRARQILKGWLAESDADHSLIAPLSNMLECQWWGVTLIRKSGKSNPAKGCKHHPFKEVKQQHRVGCTLIRRPWGRQLCTYPLRRPSHPWLWLFIKDELLQLVQKHAGIGRLVCFCTCNTSFSLHWSCLFCQTKPSEDWWRPENMVWSPERPSCDHELPP